MTKTQKITAAVDAYNKIYMLGMNSTYDSQMARHTAEQMAAQYKDRWEAAHLAKTELQTALRALGMIGKSCDFRSGIGVVEIEDKTYSGAKFTTRKVTVAKAEAAQFGREYDAAERNF